MVVVRNLIRPDFGRFLAGLKPSLPAVEAADLFLDGKGMGSSLGTGKYLCESGFRI